MDSFDKFELKLLKGDRQQKAKYQENGIIISYQGLIGLG